MSVPAAHRIASPKSLAPAAANLHCRSDYWLIDARQPFRIASGSADQTAKDSPIGSTCRCLVAARAPARTLDARDRRQTSSARMDAPVEGDRQSKAPPRPIVSRQPHSFLVRSAMLAVVASRGPQSLVSFPYDFLQSVFVQSGLQELRSPSLIAGRVNVLMFERVI